ncbi:sterol desaturase family protein [Algivirga pacifica]|uniref:Sterol desaturase family protein n=1 Tax=Algivirga pacifica TaxID=1162670 RepID=A0ABP9D3X4_9BACT
MQTYATALMYAIPGFVILMLLEYAYGYFKGFHTFNGMDTISSLSSGMTNTLKSILGISIAILSYEWVEKHIALTKIDNHWSIYVIGFIALDFAGYWSHRLNHTLNVFWNRHIVHHSSEEFNLACALRQPISGILAYHGLFLIPAALLGIPPKVIALLGPLHLFAQFWYHTRLIGKMGWLEYILVTPSHHRVHHSINPIYLDKNHSQIFIIWDKLFGTFQEELEEEPAVYGVTRPLNTWNPFKINYKHLAFLIRDAWYAKSYWDKARIWFMPLGWRPADVAEKLPVDYQENVHKQVKYDSHLSKFMGLWAWIQFVGIFSLTTLMLYLISNGSLTMPEVYYFGGIIALGIYGYTSVMDRDLLGSWVQVISSSSALGYMIWTKDWFGLAAVHMGIVGILGVFFGFGLISTLYLIFTKKIKQHDVVEAAYAAG